MAQHVDVTSAVSSSRKVLSNWSAVRHAFSSLLVMLAALAAGGSVAEGKGADLDVHDSLQYIRSLPVVHSIIETVSKYLFFGSESSSNIASVSVVSFMFRFAVPLLLWCQYVRHFNAYARHTEISNEMDMAEQCSSELTAAQLTSYLDSGKTARSSSGASGWDTEVLRHTLSQGVVP